MNDNIRCLVECCEEMKIPYQILHHTGNAVEVEIRNQGILFSNWATPLNPHSLARMCSDKEYSYEYFGRLIRMPRTMGFLDPDIEEDYRSYVHHANRSEIVDVIDSEFLYPLIVKRNSGSRGEHVYLCNQREEVRESLDRIFTKGYKGYDYVGIAQEYIDIDSEYRVVYYRGTIEFLYQKLIGEIDKGGNVSPLHTVGSRAIRIKENEIQNALKTFLQPIYDSTQLNFGGLDVALDVNGCWWLIEVNSAPSFSYFIRDNGDADVLELYRKILNDFRRNPCSEMIS